ncbi:pheophorbide a oxygenase family protein [Striga asiatica]|uniref:Pheophorbide a oxygenase family protein n=1 Tax=Striga asiatica TaxID=4170 RepID=A0A5A7R4U8_STRAF|nr:pheophorbide a oxygenase family protein [Striga asiatica]
MKPPGGVLTSARHPILLPIRSAFSTSSPRVFCLALRLRPPVRRRSCLRLSCSLENTGRSTASYHYSSATKDEVSDALPEIESLNVEVRSPLIPASVPTLSLSDQAFLILAFVACTTSIAFASLVAAAVPTLFAMQRAAISLAKLADTAREELPSTMAAIRLSGMEISDLTLELSDLSHEIADGVNKSAQAVQAAQAGVRQIGSLAHQQTMRAAKKTSRVVGQATKSLLNIISRGERSLVDEDVDPTDRIES